MPFPSRRLPLAFTLLFAGFSLATPLFADTIILNDGGEIEGKIVEEADTYVKIEVQVSKSIKDIQIIQRTEIKALNKETPDSELYAEMQKLLPLKDRLNVSDYEELLTLYPRRFATDFPSSPLLPKVREFEKKLEDEKAMVASGSVKLGGKWITPEEIAADPYNHEARILAADVTDLLAAGDLTGALQKFDTLESGYPYSTSVAPAFAPVIKALDSYDSSIKRALAENPIKLAEREKQLNALDPEGRKSAQGAFTRELQTFQKEWETAHAAKQKWLPISAWDKKSLTEAAKVIATEKARLEKVDSTARGRAAALFGLSLAALSEGKFEAAELQIAKAAEAGVDTKTVADFRAKAVAAQKAAEAAAAATLAPSDEAVAPSAETSETGTPGAAPPVDEKKEEVPAVAETPVARPEATTEGAPEKPKKPAPAKSSSDSAMKGTARDLTGLIDSDDDAEEKAKAPPAVPFKTILFILVGVMIVITVLAKVFSKPAPADFEEAATDENENGH